MSTLAPPEAPATAPASAASPTVRAVWRSAHFPLVLAALLLLIALGAALASDRGETGTLDPDGVDDNGSRALATLLRDRGVDVAKVRSVDDAVSAAADETTILVTFPALLPPEQLAELSRTDADLVVLSPDDETLTALGLPVVVLDATETSTRAPECSWPVAQGAGPVDIGGYIFATTAGESLGCYPAGPGALALRLENDGRMVTLLGNGAPWTNDRLDREGNAAFGLNLLGAHDRLQWLVPDLASVAESGGSRRLIDLLPNRVLLAAAQLGIVVLLLAAWRARRLGPVIAEPLPVVVRAAETVEGRANLYRSARARGRAADALRAGLRRRLVSGLGLSADADRATVASAVVERSSRSGSEVDDLLYGAAPDSDAALVRLADALDVLDREVRRP